jgi:hypothetical protein
MAAKFEIKKRKEGQYGFNLLASNGKIILTSGVLTTKMDVVRHIESVKKNGDDDVAYGRKTSSDNKCYFVLEAADGHIIGKSKIYSSIAGMEKGIASVKANAPYAEVYDWVIENHKNKRCKSQ